MNNAAVEKTMENVRKQKELKQEATILYQNQIIIKQLFLKGLLAIEMKKLKYTSLNLSI